MKFDLNFLGKICIIYGQIKYFKKMFIIRFTFYVIHNLKINKNIHNINCTLSLRFPTLGTIRTFLNTYLFVYFHQNNKIIIENG